MHTLKSKNLRDAFTFGFHAADNPLVKMATVTLHEVTPMRRLDSEEDIGIYCAHLFTGVGGRLSREDGNGFASEGGGPPLEHPGQPYP